MKIYILSVSKLTSSYHGGGGLAVIARNLDHAKEVILADPEIQPTDEEWEAAESFELVVDQFTEPEPKFWVFPDAGCC